MYSELREFAARSDFSDFVDGYVRDELPEGFVRGVHLGVDKFWEISWLSQWYPLAWPPPQSVRHFRTFYPRTVDFSFTPVGWNEHCRAKGYVAGSRPICIKFILFEGCQGENELRDLQ